MLGHILTPCLLLLPLLEHSKAGNRDTTNRDGAGAAQADPPAVHTGRPSSSTHTRHTQQYTHQAHPAVHTPGTPSSTHTRHTQQYTHQAHPADTAAAAPAAVAAAHMYTHVCSCWFCAHMHTRDTAVAAAAAAAAIPGAAATAAAGRPLSSPATRRYRVGVDTAYHTSHETGPLQQTQPATGQLLACHNGLAKGVMDRIPFGTTGCNMAEGSQHSGGSWPSTAETAGVQPVTPCKPRPWTQQTHCWATHVAVLRCRGLAPS
jgi:hypothetical protein